MDRIKNIFFILFEIIDFTSPKGAFFISQIIAIIYGLIITLFDYGNSILFSVGISCFFISIVLMFIEEWQDEYLKGTWIVAYLFPNFLYTIGLLLGIVEFQNSVLVKAGVNPVEPVLQGNSMDYVNSANSMLFSFYAIPVIVMGLYFLLKIIVLAVKYSNSTGND